MRLKGSRKAIVCQWNDHGNLCDESFPGPNEVLQHRMSRHGTSNRFECDYWERQGACPKSYDVWKDLEYHRRNKKHRPGDFYRCEFRVSREDRRCGEVFSGDGAEDEFQRHRLDFQHKSNDEESAIQEAGETSRQTRPERAQARQGSASAESKSDWSQISNKNETGIFCCEDCGEVAADRIARSTHLVRHPSHHMPLSESESETGQISDRNDIEDYRCLTCDFKTTDGIKKGTHMATHPGHEVPIYKSSSGARSRDSQEESDKQEKH